MTVTAISFILAPARAQDADAEAEDSTVAAEEAPTEEATTSESPTEEGTETPAEETPADPPADPPAEGDGSAESAPAEEEAAPAEETPRRGRRRGGYKPPSRGAPKGRKIGGSRTVEEDAIVVAVLTPDDVGLAVGARPTLYWYLSRTTDKRVEFAITREGEVEPALELELDGSERAGVLGIDLGDHGVKLEPGARYEWVVAVVQDPPRRARDVTAAGFVEVVEPSEQLAAELEGATTAAERAAAYAGWGVWYDAVQELSREIDRRPGDASLRLERAGLMRDVELTAVAEHDEAAAGEAGEAVGRAE